MGGTSVHVNLCRFFMFFYHCFCVPRCTRTKFVLSVVVPYPVDYVKSQLQQHTGTQAVCCTVRQPMPKITKTVNFWRFINRFSRIHHCTSMIFVSSVAIQISWFWAMPFWAAEKNFFCHANLNRSGQFQRYATESFIMICQPGSDWFGQEQTAYYYSATLPLWVRLSIKLYWCFANGHFQYLCPLTLLRDRIKHSGDVTISQQCTGYTRVNWKMFGKWWHNSY